jgi:hypothetical protein
LDDFRETCAPLTALDENDGLRLFMAATTATTTGEVKAVKKAVDSGLLGRFFSVSVSETTGASKVSVRTHNL